jgi:chromosome segregation ATPase
MIPNSNNSYICSDHGNSAKHSAAKRVWLFSPIPNSSGLCMDATEVEQSPDASILNERALTAQYETLKESNALLQLERDRAMKEKEDAEKDRDVAVEQRDRAYIECDTAKAAHHCAVVECDCALNRLDSQARISAELENCSVDLEGELNSLKQKFDTLEANYAKLEQEKENSTALISTFADNVSRLQTRVAALESQAVQSTNATVKNTGNQMRYISLFLSKLFPELTKRSGKKSYLTFYMELKNHFVNMLRV